MNPNNDSLLNQIVSPNSLTGQRDLSLILNQIFYAGLVLAAALAVVMIVRGGIQYMTTDSIDGKGGAKLRIQAALGGLVLAFASVLILNTINPSLTKLNLEFRQVNISAGSAPGLEGTPNEVIDTINKAVSSYNSEITQEVINEMIRTGQIPSGLSASNQKILAEALAAVDKMKTGAIPGTDQGNLACAAAVNKIVAQALGQPINGSLSTVDMKKSLDSSNRFTYIGSDFSNAMPGDIVISPTGEKVGHVGIVAGAGGSTIISNSSSAAAVKANFTASSWTQRYENERNLGVYIYRPN
jgi:hypothetical protein